ncbi:MAG: PAS domain S-box protein [Gammaproteobacteria bacterium]|jgi:PAS domain S-box-containing protein|nr:PAS domain S-box protein [Gammaproteobacteria bacterium]
MADRPQEKTDLERIIDAAPDATIVVDFEGRIDWINVQAEKLFGYKRDELIGKTVEVLIPNRFRDAHVAHRNVFSKKPEIREMGARLELYGCTKSGAEFPIDVNLSPIKVGGRQIVIAAVRDFTEHKENEAELRAAKNEAQAATAMKSRFLAAASHDLRQPLQSLGLYLAVLKKKLQEDELQEVATKMRSSLDAMGDLLDRLLDLSKLETGAISPELEVFPVQDLLDQLEADNMPLAQKKGLELHIEKSPLVIRSDPSLLQRVVDNFVTNAIKYTDTGKVMVSCQTSDDKVCRLEVADTGIGIPESAVESIFEEYVQLDNQVRDRSKGQGLGLAIVNRIALLLDHSLDVKSKEGQGSVFSVEVPVTSEVVLGKSSTEDVSETTLGEHRTLLIIDDDAAIVDATVMMLNEEGCEVYAASSGDEALDLLSGGVRPDIVVTDFRLPGSNGIAVIENVREHVDTALPAILITGDISAQQMSETDIPDCKVLRKPVNTEELIALIREKSH